VAVLSRFAAQFSTLGDADNVNSNAGCAFGKIQKCLLHQAELAKQEVFAGKGSQGRLQDYYLRGAALGREMGMVIC
jgi:hypothetical protein